ncbi:hypothetical protein RB597_010329 [Gaeumannomyces tritici]
MEAAWTMSGGQGNEHVAAFRKRAINNLFVFENMWGVFVTTHPDARRGMLFSASEGGRASGGGVILRSMPQDTIFPWQMDNFWYQLPSPRDFLAATRYYNTIAKGDDSFRDRPWTYTQLLTREELANVNRQLAKLSLPTIRHRASVLHPANHEDLRLDAADYDQEHGRCEMRIVGEIPPYFEVDSR